MKYSVRSSGLQPMPFEISEAAIHRRDAEPALDPIELPDRRGELAVERAGPEPARAIDLAVVEALSPSFNPGRSSQRSSSPSSASVAKPLRNAIRKPPSSRSAEQPLGLQRPVIHGRAERAELIPERWARDVDPPEQLVARTPHRAFAEHVLAVDDAARRDRRHASSVWRRPADVARPSLVGYDANPLIHGRQSNDWRWMPMDGAMSARPTPTAGRTEATMARSIARWIRGVDRAAPRSQRTPWRRRRCACST